MNYSNKFFCIHNNFKMQCQNASISHFIVMYMRSHTYMISVAFFNSHAPDNAGSPLPPIFRERFLDDGGNIFYFCGAFLRERIFGRHLVKLALFLLRASSSIPGSAGVTPHRERSLKRVSLTPALPGTPVV